MREMKDSGIEWIGEIPKNWELKRLQYSLNEINIKNFPIKTEQVLSLVKDKGVMLYEDKGNQGNKAKEDVTEYKVAFPNTLIVNSMNILIGSVGISNYLGCVSPVYYVFKETENSDLRFINYIFNTREFQSELKKYANGILEIRLRVSSSDIFKRKIALPTKEEQSRIASFLDSKCSEIDSLHSDINEQIETLKEYKKSVITEAVTKGLDPDVEMKDSGNQYWGKIPTNWHLLDIKYLFEIVKRIAGHEGYDILSVTQNGLKIKDISSNEGQIAESYVNYQFVYPGDFVMNHMDLLTGWVDCSKLFGVTSPDYRVFRLRNQNNNSNYYKYIMQTCYMNRIFYSLGQGVSNLGRWRLQTSSFNNFMVPVPPAETQKDIADYLDEKCSKINVCIDDKKKQLETLEQYKKSLIYEYVTGKKEVPANA